MNETTRKTIFQKMKGPLLLILSIITVASFLYCKSISGTIASDDCKRFNNNRYAEMFCLCTAKLQTEKSIGTATNTVCPEILQRWSVNDQYLMRKTVRTECKSEKDAFTKDKSMNDVNVVTAAEKIYTSCKSELLPSK